MCAGADAEIAGNPYIRTQINTQRDLSHKKDPSGEDLIILSTEKPLHDRERDRAVIVCIKSVGITV